MELKELQNIMVKHGLSIRAIPDKQQAVYALCHKDVYPDGKQMCPSGFNREMWVVEQQPAHAGQFVVEENCGQSSLVRFSGSRFFNSLEEIVEAYR